MDGIAGKEPAERAGRVGWEDAEYTRGDSRVFVRLASLGRFIYTTRCLTEQIQLTPLANHRYRHPHLNPSKRRRPRRRDPRRAYHLRREHGIRRQRGHTNGSRGRAANRAEAAFTSGRVVAERQGPSYTFERLKSDDLPPQPCITSAHRARDDAHQM